MKKTIALWTLICLAGLLPLAAQTQKTLLSPDHHVRFNLSVAAGAFTYSVSLNDRPVIVSSPLKLSLDGDPVTREARLIKSEPYVINESYPWYGAHATATGHANGMRMTFAFGKGKSGFTLDVRAYNGGVAFRWVLPGAPNATHIPDEATGFTLPGGSTAWYHNLRGHYEGAYDQKGVDTVGAGEWAAPPVTFKLPGRTGYGAITEADLVGYGGMALQTDGARGFVLRLPQHQPVSYPYELRYSKQDVAASLKPAVITGTITTPWRVILTAGNLGMLVNSDLVHNLCPPPDPKLFPGGNHTAWVKPGRAVWKYLDGGGPSTLENMKKFSRQAGALGFQYNILEGFWSRWPDDSLRELVDYSRKLGVGIWVWEHSKRLRDPGERHQFFQRCHDLGFAGVKIDFFDSEAKSVIDLYDSILRETAQLHLLVDFHGADKPTGLARTWPNELNREAVKGMESRSLKDRATHATILPFTRYLAGHADYTHMIFSERKANTTWANQVASAVILGAPLLTFAASPEHILASPCVGMIKSIPATWDQTMVLAPSEIGTLAVFARRKGNTWFLAVMNGTKSKTLDIPLSFLGPGTYHATMLRDAAGEAATIKKETRTATEHQKINITLGEGGGFIARFDKR